MTEVLHFMFSNIVAATLSLTALLLLGIGLYNWRDRTPAACARRSIEMARVRADRRLEEARSQQEARLRQARLKLSEHLRAARDSAEDVAEAAAIFAEEYRAAKERGRRVSGHD